MKNFKQNFKRIVVGGALIAYIFSFLAASFINTSPASAELDLAAQQNRTIAWGILECLKKDKGTSIFGNDGYLKAEVKGSDRDKLDIFTPADDEVSVGHELIQADGTAKCSSLSFDRGLSVKGIDMNTTVFLDSLYVNSGGGNYKLIEGARERIYNLINKALQSPVNAVGQAEKDRRVAVALAQCIEKVTGSFDRDEVNIPGLDGKYQYIKGKNKEKEIQVGYDITEPDPTNGNKIDGKWSCETIANLAKFALGRDKEAFMKAFTNAKTAAAGGAGATKDIDCDGGGALGWILCPIFELGANVTADAFDKVLKPLLSNIPVSADADDSAYKAWSGFRLIGNLVLVGAMLLIVYAQAKGSK